MSFFRKLWRGEAKFWQAFWVAGLITFGILFVFVLALHALMHTHIAMRIFIVCCAVFISNVYLLIVLKRNYKNAQWKWSGWLALALTAVAVAGSFLRVVSGIYVMSTTGFAPLDARYSNVISAIPAATNQCLAEWKLQHPGDTDELARKNWVLDCTYKAIGFSKGKTPLTASEPTPTVPMNQTPLPTPQTPREKCEGTLRDNAIKQGADPTEYVAKNQAWVDQCIQGAQP